MSEGVVYDAIIVGGGIVGASCAWHLLDAGLDSVLILEKDSPASKASGRAAGHLSTYTSRKYERTVHEYSLDFHRSLNQRHDKIELRTDVDHVLARSDTGRDRLSDLAASNPDDFQFLSGEEFASANTGFNTEGITAGLIYDGAVHTDPYSLTTSLISEAESNGAVLQLETVQEINQTDDGFVVSANRDYESPIVVNAAGAWSGRVASMVGIDLPVKARTSQIAVLEPPKPIDVPMFHCPDLGLYGRQEMNGDILIGGGTSEEIPDPDAFSTDAREAFLQYVSENSRTIVESLDQARLINHWAERCTATPDRRPLIGPTAISGFYVCTGFNGGGVARSPFAGKLIAEYVMELDLSFPTDPYRVDRKLETSDFDVLSASTDW